ncbi:MAG: Hercynine oxygenase [Anaerolineae bacterium]|nr:Hercynine oxygenase [Anaerolineae bacterium]
MSDDRAELEAKLKQMQEDMARLQAQLETGAVAQGEGASAAMATEGSVAVGRDVGGDVVQGDQVAGDKVNLNWLFVQIVNQAAPDPALQRFRELKQRYLENLARDCDVLRLNALGGEQSVGKQLKLSQVYISLNVLRPMPHDQDELKGFKKRYIPLLKVVSQPDQHAAILGQPGGGKSTFVKQLIAWIAMAHLGDQTALAQLKGWPAGHWPLLVVLRDLTERLAGLPLDGLSDEQVDQQLLATIHAQWQAEMERLHVADLGHRLDDLLAQERLLLVFDGLDEVPETIRPRVRRALQALLHAPYLIVGKMIVTCRIRSYTSTVALPDVPQFTLAGFSDDQIRDFVAAWYHAQGQLNHWSNDEIKGRTSDLQRAATSANLSELAENPLLLTVMAIIHQRQVRLPPERVRLYSQAVQILLENWQKHKGLHVSFDLQTVLNDTTAMRRTLQMLAYTAHQRQSQQGLEAHLTRPDILQAIDQHRLIPLGLVDEFLNYVDHRAGLLIGLGGDAAGGRPQLYDFPHHTFQEYLAGCQMVTGRDRTVRREFWQRASEGDFWYLAAQYGTETLLYSDRPDPERLLDLAYDLCQESAPQSETNWRAVLWSGQMASLLGAAYITADQCCGPAGGVVYLQRLRQQLVNLLTGNRLPVIERAEAGNVLAQLGDPRPEVLTVDAMHFCAVPPGPFWLGSNDSDDEKPPRQFDIGYGYWLARYPVTVAQWRKFVAASGHKPTDVDSLRDPDNRPVRYVTWFEAVEFTNWVTDRWHKTGLLPPDWQARLPSEAEWEKAARGGLKIPQTPIMGALAGLELGRVNTLAELVENNLPQRRYPWGQQADPNCANYSDTGIGDTSAVGCFPQGKSGYGAEELSGNGWEWTRSLWGTDFNKPDFRYPYNSDDGREDLNAKRNVMRVLRGGAFDGSSPDVRCAFRGWHHPGNGYYYRGFRVVLSPFF